jgi:hypothetical protein
MERTAAAKELRAPALGLIAAGFIFGRHWPFYAALVLLALSLCDCRLSRNTAGALRKAAEAAAKAVSAAALALVFFLAVTPSALLYRLFNRRGLDHFKRDPGKTLFEEPQEGAFSRDSFEKPW